MNKRPTWLIFAPLDLEIEALRSGFGVPFTHSQLSDGSTIWAASIDTLKGPVSVRIVQLKLQGVLQAGVTAALVIEQLLPQIVVSFGIAGRLDEADVSLEDVVVCNDLFYYEPAKETSLTRDRRRTKTRQRQSSRHQARTKPFGVDGDLLKHGLRVRAEIKDQIAFRLHFGPVASGEKLISAISAPTRRVVLALNDKMLAIDMEAAGIAAAASEATSSPRLLVVKGISDHADQKKRSDQKHRVPAARNASIFLARMVQSYDAQFREPVALLPFREIRRLAKDVCAIISPWASAPLVEEQVAQFLAPMKDPLPTVFYHWRMRDRYVHWVDFHFMLILRQLHQLGFPIHLLVSDVFRSCHEAGSANTLQTIRHLFNAATKTSWYKDVVTNHRASYVTFASAKGFNDEIEKIRGLSHVSGVEHGNLVAEEWIQFMVWSLDPETQCILFYWDRDGVWAGGMAAFLSLRPLLVPTPDIRLGRTLGKIAFPGKSLMIDPPGFDSIMNWIETHPPLQLVKDLFRQLNVGHNPHAGDAILLTLLDKYPNSKRIYFSNSKSAYSTAVRGLIGLLASFREFLFSEWT